MFDTALWVGVGCPRGTPTTFGCLAVNDDAGVAGCGFRSLAFVPSVTNRYVYIIISASFQGYLGPGERKVVVGCGEAED